MGSKLVATNFSLKLYSYFSLCLKESGVVFGYPLFGLVPPVLFLGPRAWRRGAWSFLCCAVFGGVLWLFPLLGSSRCLVCTSWPVLPVGWSLRGVFVLGTWTPCSITPMLFARLVASGGRVGCGRLSRLVARVL